MQTESPAVQNPEGTGTTDADLIHQALQDPERFGVIFDRHATAVHAFLARRAGRDLADDVLSEVFTLAFDRRRRYDPAWPSARSWLYGIAHNLLRNRLRAERRRTGLLARAPIERDQDPWDDVDAAIDARSSGQVVVTALRQLPPGERDVIQLVAWEQLPLIEVARVLGIPAGTARSRLHRARAALKAALDTNASGGRS